MTRPLALTLSLCTWLGLFVASGCHQSYYQQPYGGYGGYNGYGATPYGYPAGTTYPAPIQTLTPGQPYVPGGMSPSTIPPGSTTPTYQPPGGTLQPIPDNSNTAPPYNPNTSPLAPSPYFGPSTSITPAAPNYSAVTPMGTVQPTAWNEPAPLNPPMAGIRDVYSPPIPGGVVPNGMPQPLTGVSPAMPTDAFAAPRVGPAPAATTSDPFFPPTGGSTGVIPASQSEPAGAGGLFDLKANKVQNAVLTAFAQDARFQWLRGVVTQERRDGSWSIIYNDAPRADDRWSGHLTLSPSPQLDRLKDGDVVTVRGYVDAVRKDHLGKPVYVVTEIDQVTVVK